jgi:hypothetical protein
MSIALMNFPRAISLHLGKLLAREKAVALISA